MTHKLTKYILIDKNSLNTFLHCHGTNLFF